MKYPEPSIIAPITRAIFLNQAVTINYVSMSSGKSKREIVPLALVDNGLRWHVRAYDRKKRRFSDFVLTRIMKAEISDNCISPEETKSNDIQWNRIVELELIPHPKRKHKETIMHDFDMEDGVLRINVRAATAGYLLRRLNVDCTEHHVLASSVYQLWLRNLPALYGVETIDIASRYKRSLSI
jgi:predicted DNA-binding transcriptional regulator YafY